MQTESLVLMAIIKLGRSGMLKSSPNSLNVRPCAHLVPLIQLSIESRIAWLSVLRLGTNSSCLILIHSRNFINIGHDLRVLGLSLSSSSIFLRCGEFATNVARLLPQHLWWPWWLCWGSQLDYVDSFVIIYIIWWGPLSCSNCSTLLLRSGSFDLTWTNGTLWWLSATLLRLLSGRLPGY